MNASEHSTDVERLAAWSLRAGYDKLSKTSVEQLPVHILDCVSCCISALGAPPVAAMRAMIGDMAGSGPNRLIGGGNTTLAYACMWHTALVRYVDFMDNFLAAKETCHTGDNFGAVFTTAAHVGASGKDFMTALAVAYTAQSRYVDHGTFMERGLDHTSQLGFSIGAATGRLLGMTEAQIANGVAMAAASDAAYDNIRSKPLSQWKGFASSQSALGAINAILLARGGVQGPLAIVEGRGGIDQLLGAKIEIDWAQEGYEGIATSAIKKYNSEIHTQSSIECMIQLRNKNQVDPALVQAIEAEVTDITFNFTGGGSYGPATIGIDSKEQADHSLPYLLAVALIDGAVGPEQFAPERVKRRDVQQLLLKVSVKPDKEFTEAYPTRMPARLTVRTSEGKSAAEEVQDYPGMPVRPFTWDEAVEKFDALSLGRVERPLGNEIIAAVKSMETTSARDLLDLVAQAKPPSSNAN